MSDQPYHGSPKEGHSNTNPIPEKFLVHARIRLPEDQSARREAGMHQDGEEQAALCVLIDARDDQRPGGQQAGTQQDYQQPG